MEQRQFTESEARAFFDQGKWKSMTATERFAFQLYQDLLCMPFSEFHKAAEEALGRPVYTHEFAFRDHLIDEFNGKKGKSSLEDIIALLPKEKTIIVEVKDNG